MYHLIRLSKGSDEFTIIEHLMLYSCIVYFLCACLYLKTALKHIICIISYNISYHIVSYHNITNH